MFERIAGDRKRGGRRAYGAAAASVAVHVLLVLLLGWGMREGVLLANETPGTGIDDNQWPGGGGGGGGGGGEQVVFIDIPPPPPPPAVPTPPEPDALVVPEEVVPPPPPPTPVPPAEPAKVTPPAPRPPAPTTGAGAGPGTGATQGPGAGPGQGPGTGPGSGGGSGGGTGGGVGSGTGPGTGRGEGRIIPPSTDLLLLPPDAPRPLRGRDVVARVTVDETGNVIRVEMVTSSGNGRYDEALRRKLMEYKFTPGRNADTNRPVTAATDITFTL